MWAEWQVKQRRNVDRARGSAPRIHPEQHCWELREFAWTTKVAGLRLTYKVMAQLERGTFQMQFVPVGISAHTTAANMSQ